MDTMAKGRRASEARSPILRLLTLPPGAEEDAEEEGSVRGAVAVAVAVAGDAPSSSRKLRSGDSGDLLGVGVQVPVRPQKEPPPPGPDGGLAGTAVAFGHGAGRNTCFFCWDVKR